MTDSVHSIRLRGPWQVSARNNEGVELLSRRVNIRTPDQCWSWLSDISSAQISATRSFQFTRRFNWPNPNPSPRSVSLVIRSEEPSPFDRVELNGEVLSGKVDDGVGSASVFPLLRPLLKSGNELQLRVPFNESNNESSFGQPHADMAGFDVTLEIED